VEVERERERGPWARRGVGAVPRDTGGRRGQRDAVDVTDRWAGTRRGPSHQRLGAAW
jgi:hypothetical protein